ncbi:MAG: NifU family protein, partial [Candidatus Aenigmatarchaeota archaeon]
MSIHEKIEEIREILSENDGDLELMEFDEDNKIAHIRLKGSCVYCPFSRITVSEII